MKTLVRALLSSVAMLVFTLTTNTAVQAQKRIEDRFAVVNWSQASLSNRWKGRSGHSYARLRPDQSHVWRPLMVELARTRTVIAPDLRGFGQSSKPNSGYEKKTMAQDIFSLLWRNTTKAGCRSRAHLLRALLE